MEFLRSLFFSQCPPAPKLPETLLLPSAEAHRAATIHLQRPPPEESRAFKELVGVVPHSDYARLSAHVYVFAQGADNHLGRGEGRCSFLPPGWEVLVCAGDFGLDKEGYGAVAYLNRRSRSVVVAQRGTANEEGVYADVYMMLLETPLHYELASEFCGCVREEVDRLQSQQLSQQQHQAQSGTPDNSTDLLKSDDPEDDHAASVLPYSISYTGHSLGAVLAARQAFLGQAVAVTFDCPGSRPLLQQLAGPGAGARERLDLWAATAYVTYLSKPNLANTLFPHLGTVLHVISESRKDHDHGRVQRLSHLFNGSGSFQWRDPKAWILGAAAKSLPEALDLSAGAKINYLLRHKNRHEMRFFANAFQVDESGVSADPQLQMVDRWPAGPLECMKFDACNGHLAAADKGAVLEKTPLQRASSRTLATVFATQPADGRRACIDAMPSAVRGLFQLTPKSLLRRAAKIRTVKSQDLPRLMGVLQVLVHSRADSALPGVVEVAGVNAVEFQALVWRWHEELECIAQTPSCL